MEQESTAMYGGPERKTEKISITAWAEDIREKPVSARYHCQKGNIPSAEKINGTWMVDPDEEWPHNDWDPDLLVTFGEHESPFQPISRRRLHDDPRYARDVCKVHTANEDDDAVLNIERAEAWLDAHLISHKIDISVRDALAIIANDFREESPVLDKFANNHLIFDHARVYYSVELNRYYIVSQPYNTFGDDEMANKTKSAINEFVSNVPAHVNAWSYRAYSVLDDESRKEYLSHFPYVPASWWCHADLIVITSPITYRDWLVTEAVIEDCMKPLNHPKLGMPITRGVAADGCTLAEAQTFANDVRKDLVNFPSSFSFTDALKYLAARGGAWFSVDALHATYRFYRDAFAGYERTDDDEKIKTALDAWDNGALFHTASCKTYPAWQSTDFGFTFAS